MGTLSSLKNKNSSIEKLSKALDSMSAGGGNKKDERVWKPTVDKAGNGYAIIRFLDSPEVDGEDGMPWATMFSHSFQGPGGWFIENCPTTMGKDHDCPLCQTNNKLWGTGNESDKEIARKQKRKLKYISNILVVKDPSAPENEGKVFLYEYGKKIFDKIQEQIKPQFEDESAVNPFNFWEGANFKLKIRQVEGYRNYDKSEFEAPSAVADDDSEIEKLWKASYSLKALVDPSLFKTYDDLSSKLARALGNVKGASKPALPKIDEDVANEDDSRSSGDDNKKPEEDDVLSYFESLARDD